MLKGMYVGNFDQIWEKTLELTAILDLCKLSTLPLHGTVLVLRKPSVQLLYTNYLLFLCLTSHSLGKYTDKNKMRKPGCKPKMHAGQVDCGNNKREKQIWR